MRMFQPYDQDKLVVGQTVYNGPNVHDRNPIWKQKVARIIQPIHHSEEGYTEAKVLTDHGLVMTVTWYASQRMWRCTSTNLSESPAYGGEVSDYQGQVVCLGTLGG